MFLKNIISYYREHIIYSDSDPQLIRMGKKFVMDYETIKPSQKLRGLSRQAGLFISKIKSGEFRLEDFYGFESLMMDIYPIDRVRGAIFILRLRYQTLVGDKVYDKFLESRHYDVQSAPEDLLREEAKILIDETSRAHVFQKYIGNVKRTISRNNMFFLLTGIVLFVVAFQQVFGSSKVDPITCLILVGTIGLIGASLSIEQRIRSIGIDGVSLIDVLKVGQGGLMVARLSGVFFAIVLTLIFAGGLISGSLFPKYPTITPPNDFNLLDFLKNLMPQGFENQYKLLFWCFVAGFAERFVPDVVDGLIKSGNLAVKTSMDDFEKQFNNASKRIGTPYGKKGSFKNN